MSKIPSGAFLAHLKSLYPPSSSVRNPWYIVAAVTFSSLNRPEAVPIILKHTMQEFDDKDRKLHVVRGLRDALFKSGLHQGYPRAINALASLYEATPVELRDTKPLRDTTLSTEELTQRGRVMFTKMYGETADEVQSLLDAVFPDFGFFSNTIGYGYTYSFCDVLSPKETSFALIAPLVAMNTPRQLKWHMQAAVRNGATKEEVIAARQIALDICADAGVAWEGELPTLD